MCDLVNVIIENDSESGLRVQVASGAEDGVRTEHAADVALRTWQSAMTWNTARHEREAEAAQTEA